MILIFCGSVSAFSFSGKGPRIIDNAGLFDDRQEASLGIRIDTVSENYEFDLVIVTEKSTGFVPAATYADDFFENNGYGFGENWDGCLVLFVTNGRDYAFSASGRGIKILNPFADQVLINDMHVFLSNDNYYDACQTYINRWEEFLALDTKGRNYNFFHKYNLQATCAAVAISIIIGFIITLLWRRGMNTALAQTNAAAYIIDNSLSFKVKKDQFLYSIVTKTKRESSSTSGGGGGSGSRTSSSGRSHSGSSGKY